MLSIPTTNKDTGEGVQFIQGARPGGEKPERSLDQKMDAMPPSSTELNLGYRICPAHCFFIPFVMFRDDKNHQTVLKGISQLRELEELECFPPGEMCSGFYSIARKLSGVAEAVLDLKSLNKSIKKMKFRWTR